MLWVIILICHEDYLLHVFFTKSWKSWKLLDILLERLHVNGCKLEGKGTSVEFKGLFSNAEIARKGGGAAHSNLPEDNLSS